MKKKILTLILLLSLLFSSTGFVFAIDQPEQPTLTDSTNNESIEQYNKEVEEYNAKVDEYNTAVDAEYEAAAENVRQQNEVGLKTQEESQKAHDDAIAQNETEQQRVDTENAKIDEQNKIESEEVEKYNSDEDAKVEESKANKEKIEKENADKKAQYDNEVATVEKEYEDAVAAEKERVDAIKEQNEEIRKHNAEEDQKLADTETANKAEEERINAENAKRESQYLEDIAQYDIDNAKYEENYANYTSNANQTDIKNEQIILNAGYESIAEYNMLPLKSGPTYDEETGTYIDSSEQFNNLLTKAVYRNEVRSENNTLKEKEYTSTVEIQKAEVKSGETYTLYLTHYLSSGQSYVETITFDANDTITIKSLAYANNSKPLYEEENYGAFYSYQGDKYLSYYWYQTYGQFEYPPLNEKGDYQEISDKGNSYTISYKNGKKYSSDSNEIYVTYYYNSRLTCNIPLSEPKAPTEPVLELLEFEPIIYNPNYIEELDETENTIEKRVVSEPTYTEVPNIYTPNYKEYIPISHISPNFVEVPDVNIWEIISAPVKVAYLTYLSLIDLLPEEPTIEPQPEPQPEPTIEPVVESEPIAEPEPIIEPVIEKPNVEEPVVEEPIDEEPSVEEPINDSPINNPTSTTKNTPTPIIQSTNPTNDIIIADNNTPKTETTKPATTIPNNKTPKAIPIGLWALLNLIATIISCLIALILLFIKKKTDDEKEDYTDEEKKDMRGMIGTKLASILIGVISIIIFIFTEDMTQPMVLTDKWTILMILLLIVEMINIFIIRQQSKGEEDND